MDSFNFPWWLYVVLIIEILMPIILLIGFIIVIIILIKKLINAKRDKNFICNQDNILQEEKDAVNKKIKKYRIILISVILILLCIVGCFVLTLFGSEIKDNINEKKYQKIASKNEITNYTELPYSFNINDDTGYTDNSTINIIKEFEYNGKKYILYPGLENVKYIADAKKEQYIAKIGNYYLDPVTDFEIDYNGTDYGNYSINRGDPYIQWADDFDDCEDSLDNLEKHYYEIYNINYAPDGVPHLATYDKLYVEEQFYYDYEWSKRELLEIANFTYPIDWTIYCDDDAKKYGIDIQNTKKANFASTLPMYISRRDDITVNIYHSNVVFPDTVNYNDIILYKYEYNADDELCKSLSKFEKYDIDDAAMINIYIHDNYYDQMHFHKVLLDDKCVYIAYIANNDNEYMHYENYKDTLEKELSNGDIIIYVEKDVN